MTELPADILITALAIADGSFSCLDEVDVQDIARAIAAERERCAAIADDYDQAPGDDTPMGPIMVAQVAIAGEISRRIRHPEGGAA
ncbi:hypothetical protein [Pinisolibacter sp.]|uniref:hypothetical protein n=1 Tax=Pinisolibacter sp. TaxID=2172024 RepID=UPI002FDE0142